LYNIFTKLDILIVQVVYPAKYGVPSPSQCEGAGLQSIERIFGSSSGPLELFLLKRK